MPSERLFFPNFPKGTYGTTCFWAEEYWVLRKIQYLQEKYPQLGLEGIIDIDFSYKLLEYLKEPPHNQLIHSQSYTNLSGNLWDDYSTQLNISTSHAPAQFIATEYLSNFKEKFCILTLDAHLDYRNNELIHNAWITEVLAGKTIAVGLWGDPSNELIDTSNFAFTAQQLEDLIYDTRLNRWLQGKCVYVTIDLDYYKISKNPFLGYANFWHRNLIIGHSMNLEQQLEMIMEQLPNSNINIGKLLGFFTDLASFKSIKIESIEKQSVEILKTLKTISRLINQCSAKILRLDFVEYSPLTDWEQLTFIEFSKKYNQFYKTIEYSLINAGSF